MNFEKAYDLFLQHHIRFSSGERLRRLKESDLHAEKKFAENIWWPSFLHIDFLHPEYEVSDFKDGIRFLDYAYIRHTWKICFEIDGFGPHYENISRQKFSDNLMRQNHLVIDHWIVIRFSFDDILNKPRYCQQIIQQLLGRILNQPSGNTELPKLSPVEKEVLRLFVNHAKEIKLAEVSDFLQITKKTAYKYLNSLTEKGFIVPVNGRQRIRFYRLGNEPIHW